MNNEKIQSGLVKLVEKFKADEEYYKSIKYNESQLRADFLDPFFEVLGWDIKNNQGKSTHEREVLLEEPLKADANSNTKKPDYTFRLFSERKFFLEAKKPSVKIDTDPEPASQIRRYGFTAKLKISVLSNFEYLAIYDCSQKVNPGDPATTSRINLFHYTEFPNICEELINLLGQNTVYSGNFDNVWSKIEGHLRLTSVDSLFLGQINDWRVTLGKEVFGHNPDLDENQLNDIVQSYINSIIFLRVCEDRNIETYKTLLRLAEESNFQALITKFQEADRKYNAGLFNHPLNSEIITQNHSAFWVIIEHLYFPESPYSFSVFASDILGNIYEVFLGEQLHINDGSISLDKKPENIDRDVVTTPTYIIRDILSQTVIPRCNGLSDTEILAMTFADVACGSGAFLLETYQLLHDILVDYYIQDNPEILIRTSVDTFKLPFEIKHKLLVNCIHGVDKDYNAVEACKFGLLLKLLENEDQSSIPIPALPDLSNNIFYGNSLLDSNDVTESSREIINPFDFDKVFDVIIGNPPYMATEHIKRFTPSELPAYKAKYNTAYKQFDKYFVFIERSISLLKEGGSLGYIVPSKFFKVGAGRNLRNLLSNNCYVQNIVSFGANQVFDDKTTYTCLLIARKDALPAMEYYEVSDLDSWRARLIDSAQIDSISHDLLDENGWVLVPKPLKQAFSAIKERSIELGELVGDEAIYNGIQTSANRIYIHRPTNQDDDYYYFTKDNIKWQIEKAVTRPYFQTSSGQDNLNTYRSFSANSFVIYPYKKIEGKIVFIPIDEMKSRFPHAMTYLNHYYDVLSNPKRDIKPEPETKEEWYRYGRHQSLDKCDVPEKIIVGVLSQGDKYAIDYSGTLISSGGTAGYCMITLPGDCPYSIHYIQALLNAKYLEWFSAVIGEVFRGGYIARGTKVLKRLPIRIIDFANEEDTQLHDSISHIQKALIDIQSDIDSNSQNQRKLIGLNRKFSQAKKELDRKLFDLYNLGDDDANIPLITEVYEAY